MATRLTPFSKLLLTVIIVAAIVLGGRWFLNNTEVGGDLKDQAQQNNNSNTEEPARERDRPRNNNNSGGGNAPSDVINIGVVTWGGYAGGQYYNEGFKANKNSRFYKDYGFGVDFKVLDDFVASREAFRRGDVDLLWATIDAFPTEAGEMSDLEPQVVFQADWSRGGDAIVVRRGISNVADLKGKKIAVAELTPSHSFLLWLLEAGNMKEKDVELVRFTNAIDAAESFKTGQVDAAVVWSPDDEACLDAISGSRVLESSKTASNIIADVFIAKKSWVEANKEKVRQLYEGWMKGAAEINSNEGNQRKAARILAENFEGVDEEWAFSAINNVRLTTHGDNQNFFGLNRDFSGVTGDRLYSRMSQTYKGLGYIEGRAPTWREIANSSLVKNTSLSGASHAAEKSKSFTKVTKEEGNKKEAIATKPVSISFRTGEYKLDENAKYIIDREFLEIARAFSNSRIRIEGNTDDVGSRSSNIALSLKRAESVRDYLVSEHGMPVNRFIVVGNGPDKPVASNSTAGGKAKNRRTDFELVRE